MNLNDHIAWANLVRNYSVDDALIQRLFEELVRKYSGRGRFYHNWEHIVSLRQFSAALSTRLQAEDIVNFAIYYHDFVYNVLRKDNEQRSAVEAEKRMRLLRVPEEKIAQVKTFIEATQTHRVSQNHPLAADLSYFLDFDMAILGAEPAQYDLYARQVRKEYWIYPSSMYKAGRKKFLESCLKSESVFLTAEFRRQFEAAARQNMARELQMYQ